MIALPLACWRGRTLAPFEQCCDRGGCGRLTSEERMRLEEAARRDGFRTLSDYLRAAGMMRAG